MAFHSNEVGYCSGGRRGEGKGNITHCYIDIIYTNMYGWLKNS